ncbi:MAG: type II secretion system GspH family protein [Fibromonadales bacterium]|nr:type II secretion system GspH family protein [Fibromonadales bacterium]
MSKKSGFGLMEVMVAAVVLAFLIIGLNLLQMGNREAILRVRARDAANLVAQHVLDSLGAIGINSLAADGDNMVFRKPGYKAPESKLDIAFDVKVALLDSTYSADSTGFTVASSAKAQNIYAKNLEATVSWMHKNSTQSIKMAKVVR